MSSRPYITIDRIIERVYDEYGLPQVYKHQATEWAINTLLLMGSHKLLEDAEDKVYIEEGRGQLPVGFYELKPAGLREESSKITLIPQSGSFQSPADDPDESTTIVKIEGSSVVYDEYGNIIEDPNVPTSVISILHPDSDREKYEYIIKDGWVFCGIQNTVLEIAYTKIPTDFRTGQPLIPDDEKILAAITSSVAFKIAKRLFIRGEIAERPYRVIEEDYLFNMPSARSSLRVPTVDEMEALKNRYLSLIPRRNEYEDGFKSSNDPERLNF